MSKLPKDFGLVEIFSKETDTVSRLGRRDKESLPANTWYICYVGIGGDETLIGRQVNIKL